MELANELPMSKVLQLRAAIAPRGFVLPTHLNLMSSDAGNHARSAGLIIVFTDPDDAVTNTSLRATAVFMTMPPIDLPMKEDRRAVARERSLAPLQQPGRRPSIQNIRERYSDYSPRPRMRGGLTSCRLVSSAPHLGFLSARSTLPSSVARLPHTAR